MPELPEVEAYRRLAESALGRQVAAVEAPDPWFLKGGLTAALAGDVLVGARFVEARRRGKLLLLVMEPAGVLGLRFGMTGRLLVDGRPGVDALLYSSTRNETAWDRFAVRFVDGGSLVVADPRRLGGVELDPDLDRLGPDALGLGLADLRRALRDGTGPLKARLLDQGRLAGVGNLVADEALWRAGLSPLRPAGSLSPAETRRLHRHLGGALEELMGRGGSHTGDLQPERREGGHCPRDGAPLARSRVGGRSSWWCPAHQH